MFEAVEELLLEHADLETKMSDPGVHANPGLARSLGTPICTADSDR